MLTDEARILRQAECWSRQGRDVGVAIVVETFGSAPRPVGSHLVVDEGGAFHGSVSGGCVEGEVVTAALDAIEDGAPRFLDFGVADEVAWRVGLPCGGRVGVHVQKLDATGANLLAEINSEYSARRACALVTPLDGGESSLLRAGEAADDAAGAALRAGRSAVVDVGGRRHFVYVHRPPTRLAIIGAVHVAQPLSEMARIAGFDVVIVDPRAAFAAPERFPDVTLIAQWPDDALPLLGLDGFTAIAAMSHDPRIDDAALRLALASDCFYVGALGSRASQMRRVERLRTSGVTAQALARLHAPIGLDIGAVSPTEIAISVMGEIVLAQRQKPLRAELSRAAAVAAQ